MVLQCILQQFCILQNSLLPAVLRMYSVLIKKNQQGYYGLTSGYYGTVEKQGRLTLHLHMLLWIKGNLNPEDMRKRILAEDFIWHKKMLDWLEHNNIAMWKTLLMVLMQMS